MQVGSFTIWGKAQDVTSLTEGAWLVSTASHGGIKLDRARNAMVPKAARCKGGWYEEDCNIAIPAAIFPEIRDALKVEESTITDCLKRWQSPAALAALGVV